MTKEGGSVVNRLESLGFRTFNPNMREKNVLGLGFVQEVDYFRRGDLTLAFVDGFRIFGEGFGDCFTVLDKSEEVILTQESEGGTRLVRVVERREDLLRVDAGSLALVSFVDVRRRMSEERVEYGVGVSGDVVLTYDDGGGIQGIKVEAGEFSERGQSVRLSVSRNRRGGIERLNLGSGRGGFEVPFDVDEDRGLMKLTFRSSDEKQERGEVSFPAVIAGLGREALRVDVLNLVSNEGRYADFIDWFREQQDFFEDVSSGLRLLQRYFFSWGKRGEGRRDWEIC